MTKLHYQGKIYEVGDEPGKAHEMRSPNGEKVTYYELPGLGQVLASNVELFEGDTLPHLNPVPQGEGKGEPGADPSNQRLPGGTSASSDPVGDKNRKKGRNDS